MKTDNEVEQLLKKFPYEKRKLNDHELTELKKYVAQRLDWERDNGIGTVSQQKVFLENLIKISRGEKFGGVTSFSKMYLLQWSKSTGNMFAKYYHEGHFDGNINGSHYATDRAKNKSTKITSKRITLAADKRKTLGDATKERVKSAAQKYRNLTKEQAAPLVADEVHLSPGTVRRYLSTLFPGKTWDASVDSSQPIK